MAAPRLSKADPKTTATIQRIREMVKQYGVNETSRRVNRSRQNVSDISRGVRYRKVGLEQITVEQLGIRKGSGKNCRKCGNPCWLVISKVIVCVECYLLELERLGIIKIGSATGDDYEIDERDRAGKA